MGAPAMAEKRYLGGAFAKPDASLASANREAAPSRAPPATPLRQTFSSANAPADDDVPPLALAQLNTCTRHTERGTAVTG